MADPKLDEVEALLREAAQTLILPRFRSLSDGQIEEKNGPGDLVTVADREAEEMLTPAFEELVPGSVVVGEEAVSQGKVSPEILCEDRDLWLLDPVDGTWNFVQGSERFGVMCAFIRKGEVVKSWILYPVDGRCALAERGAGATFGGERIKTAPARAFEVAKGDYSSVYVEEPFRTAFLKATEAAAEIRAGHCSAYAYGDLARGLIDFVLQYKMTPWDHAPGQLLVEEAGGRFGFLPGGERYSPVPHPETPMLAVANEETWPAYAEPLMKGL